MLVTVATSHRGDCTAHHYDDLRVCVKPRSMVAQSSFKADSKDVEGSAVTLVALWAQLRCAITRNGFARRGGNILQIPVDRLFAFCRALRRELRQNRFSEVSPS